MSHGTYPCNDKMQKLSILLPLWSAYIYIRYLWRVINLADILKSRNKCEGVVLGNQDGGYLTTPLPFFYKHKGYKHVEAQMFTEKQ